MKWMGMAAAALERLPTIATAMVFATQWMPALVFNDALIGMSCDDGDALYHQ